MLVSCTRMVVSLGWRSRLQVRFYVFVGFRALLKGTAHEIGGMSGRPVPRRGRGHRFCRALLRVLSRRLLVAAAAAAEGEEVCL